MFYFKALKPGNAVLSIKHTYRRRLEKEMIYNIIVE